MAISGENFSYETTRRLLVDYAWHYRQRVKLGTTERALLRWFWTDLTYIYPGASVYCYIICVFSRVHLENLPNAIAHI